jgi:hypothetical protein
MENLLEILGIFLLSSVKFGMAGVPSAVFAGFSFFKSFTVTTAGGIAGTIVFTYLSKWIIEKYHALKERIFGKSTKKKKLFTPYNRFIVKVKMKFGLMGLSILTPSILSFPVGIFLAVRYYHNKEKIITYMSVSTMLWAVALFFLYNNAFSYIGKMFNKATSSF